MERKRGNTPLKSWLHCYHQQPTTKKKKYKCYAIEKKGKKETQHNARKKKNPITREESKRSGVIMLDDLISKSTQDGQSFTGKDGGLSTCGKDGGLDSR